MANNEKIVGVPKEVFEEFIKNLETEDVPEELVARLRKTILEDGNLSDPALRKALFAKESS